jgi:hypothetical protein
VASYNEVSRRVATHMKYNLVYRDAEGKLLTVRRIKPRKFELETGRLLSYVHMSIYFDYIGRINARGDLVGVHKGTEVGPKEIYELFERLK